MERKRKRVFQDSDDEIDNNGGLPIADLIEGASIKTTSDIKGFFEHHSADLKNIIRENRHVEDYVTKKHADQATMLKKLNDELRAERLEKNKYIREITDLKRRLSQLEAYETCERMLRVVINELRQDIRNLKNTRTP